MNPKEFDEEYDITKRPFSGALPPYTCGGRNESCLGTGPDGRTPCQRRPAHVATICHCSTTNFNLHIDQTTTLRFVG